MLCLKAVGVEEDNKWSVHYTTQKPQQGQVFLPGSQPFSSVDDLQAGVNRHNLLQDCDKLNRNGYGSCQYQPQNPTSSSWPGQSQGSTQRSKKDRGRKKSSSEEEERFFYTPQPLTPLLNPADLISCDDTTAHGYDPSVVMDTDWVPPPPLPTPEEKMRQQAEAIPADIVAINITGESFERQASFRRTAGYNDSLTRRPRKLTRRKTVTGIPDDISREQECQEASVVLPGQYSTVGRPGTACPPDLLCSSSHQLHLPQEPSEEEKTMQPSRRRIRAQRGEGISSLMASLTPTLTPHPCITSPHSSSVSLPRLATSSSLDSKASDGTAPYRTLSIASSCSQRDSASASTTDSDSQFSYQAMEDQTPSPQEAQRSSSAPLSPCTGPGESQGYQPLSPSSSIQSGHTGRDWTSSTQETDSVCGEFWSDEPLLSSSLSSPHSSHTDCNSLCSEENVSSPWFHQEGMLQSASTSSTSSWTSSSAPRAVSRSISLRKSRRPPPPPLRSDSLRRRAGRGKSPRLERQTLQTLPTPPLQDPWVPRNPSRRWQSVVNCGTVTTFEPLTQTGQTGSSTEPPPAHPHPQAAGSSGSPGSRGGGLSLALSPRLAASSPARLQHLASPSSGYSSQSNTPIPGTPLSSPLTTSPGAFSLPPASPFSTSSSSSFPLSTSSLPRARSLGEGRKRPPVPERKSSLLSSLSSSFSSTSSLSSCNSSESSTRLLPGSSPSAPPSSSSLLLRCQTVLPSCDVINLFPSSPISPSSIRTPRAKKRRQLMMMSSVTEPFSSSSSSPSSSSSSLSSSCSSEEEGKEEGERRVDERVRMKSVEEEDSSDLDSACAPIGQRRDSLSSVLSTDGLQGELSLPDLLIHEPGEEGEQEERRDNGDADVFISVSADQMLVSSRPRTTEDLFAVIHRSKRKMLGRRDSEDERHRLSSSSPSVSSSSSSSSSPPLTPTNPLVCPVRPMTPRGQRSGSSDSFKALLLRKGCRSDSASRLSAVERLCIAASGLQRAPSLPDLPEPEEDTDLRDVNAHLTVSVSPVSLFSFPVVFERRGGEQPHSQLLLPSSSPLFPLSSLSSLCWSRPPRSLTPPCSASRRFAARCRLPACPMTAILEGEEEEEEQKEEEDIFIESPSTVLWLAGKSSQQLVEIVDRQRESTNGSSFDWVGRGWTMGNPSLLMPLPLLESGV
ncbi:uncharacterized protein nhsl1a [Polymixia lowei]